MAILFCFKVYLGGHMCKRSSSGLLLLGGAKNEKLPLNLPNSVYPLFNQLSE
jgi:hypothetical protein